MRYIVLSQEELCARCLKKHSGAAMLMLDFVVCVDCHERYQRDVEPIVVKMVRDYIQPERLNEETPNNGEAIV